METQLTEGSCLCKTVRFRITGTVRAFQYCHCSRCRKFTGSAHAANILALPPALEWIAGEESLGSYMHPGETPFPTSFCKACGSSMPGMSQTGRFWVIPAGTLDEDPGITPTRNIFWGSRAPWFRDTGSLPKHDEMPDL